MHETIIQLQNDNPITNLWTRWLIQHGGDATVIHTIYSQYIYSSIIFNIISLSSLSSLYFRYLSLSSITRLFALSYSALLRLSACCAVPPVGSKPLSQAIALTGDAEVLLVAQQLACWPPVHWKYMYTQATDTGAGIYNTGLYRYSSRYYRYCRYYRYWQYRPVSVFTNTDTGIVQKHIYTRYI